MSNTLTAHINGFIYSLADQPKDKQDKTKMALDPLISFYENHYNPELEEDGTNPVELKSVTLEHIDIILGHYIISKLSTDTDERLATADAIDELFDHLTSKEGYDSLKSAGVKQITEHYRKQYDRIGKLSANLWEVVEGELDRLMAMPEDERAVKIEEMRKKADGAETMEAGYVAIEKIEDDLVYGKAINDGDNIGPIKLDSVSLDLVRPGDVINMTLQKAKGSEAWEIIELGQVYPEQYFED